MLRKLGDLLNLGKSLIHEKNYMLLGILIIFGIIIRFVWLDTFPVGITHDDADVVLSAKSYWVRGTDISGIPFPNSLFFNKTQGKISGLPSVILSPILGPFPSSLFLTRLVFVLVNILSLIFISLISYRFFKNARLSAVVFAVGLINPWMFVYSRYPTEAPFALLFAVMGIYFAFGKKAGSIFLSTFIFILSFYSYFGAKVAIPLIFPLVLFLRSQNFGDLKKNVKAYAASFLIFAVMVGGYFVAVAANSSSTFSNRLAGESAFSEISRYQTNTDEVRRASMEFPYKNVIYNKYSFVLKNFTANYFGWISYDTLFASGDVSAVYRFGEHGLFYLVDLLLLLVGIIFLAINPDKKRMILGLMLAGIALAAPLGNALTRAGDSHFFRSFLLLPVLVLMLGFGFHYLFRRFGIILVGVYFLLTVNFLIFYFFRYPVKAQDNQFLGERVLSNYIERTKEKGIDAIAVHADYPVSVNNLYLFYSDSLNTDPNGLIFIGGCEAQPEALVSIYDIRLGCPKNSSKPLVIQNQKDAGSEFFIYNDKLCEGYDMDTYRRTHKLSDYGIEKLSDQDFCNRWIFRSIN